MQHKPYTEWKASFSPTGNTNKLFEPFDMEKYESLEQSFKTLSPTEKQRYKGIGDYICQSGGPELTPLRSNYKKMCEEIHIQIAKGSFYDILPMDIYMPENVIMDLLMSLENENYIKDIYKRKKLKVTGGLNTTECTILIDCIRQGRSLLQAGSTAEMLSKPLIDFYASSAYAYAIIVLNSPLHKSIDSLKGSHGHSYNHKNGTIDFGGNIPNGTFIDLLFSMPIIQINCSNIHFKYTIMRSLELIQNHTISLSLLTLLSMVPELQSQYRNVDKEHKLIHELKIGTGVKNMKATYMFEIGDGQNLPDETNIKKSFATSEVTYKDGHIQIAIEADAISNIMPLIYQDINGRLWYVESPIDNLILPEICLHFLIISALCNIMRYSPNEWSDILFNKVSSEFSLLISKYLRLFEQKFPMLVAQYLTNYLPILTL